MKWIPITEDNLKDILEKSVEGMTPGARDLFFNHAVPPYLLLCTRTSIGRAEKIPVVARIGKNVLVFDDVEDEFGVGKISEDGKLHDWTLFGTLDAAVNALATAPRQSLPRSD